MSSLRALLAGRPAIHDQVRPDLATSALVAILARARTGQRSAPSLSIGAWKSGEDLFGWRDPCLTELYRVLSRDFLDGAIPTGWAMVNQDGSSHPRHRHDGAAVSGVYYVQPGTEPTAPTIFELASGEEAVVEPKFARLVLFPSDLWHRVPRVPSGMPRVTIAFDVRR